MAELAQARYWEECVHCGDEIEPGEWMREGQHGWMHCRCAGHRGGRMAAALRRREAILEGLDELGRGQR